MIEKSTKNQPQQRTPAEARPKSRIQDAVIRLAGNSQDGIQVIGGFLARLAGRTAKDVMTYMTIPATISGGASIYQVRLGTGEILSAGDDVDVLVAFYQHSYNDHIGTLREGGILLYDLDQVQPDATDTRHRAVGVPITNLTVEAIGGTSKDKGKNMFVLGLLTRLFDLDSAKLEQMLRKHFDKKADAVVHSVIDAFSAGYGYDIGKFTEICHFDSPTTPSTTPRVVMDGNQAIAYGALTAGVRFSASYPITPATTVMEILRAELPKYGGTLVQAEDELAAIAMACGASYAGQPALTSTSGPGLSLKSEALGWAVMAEIPVLIVDVQRGGPATGLPTMVEQSDLDQALATRIEAWDMPDLPALMRDLTPKFEPVGPDFKPYRITEEGIPRHAPPGTPVVDGRFPIVTGLEHDEAGQPSAQPENHAKMVAKRRRKLELLASRLPRATVDGPSEGDVLLVGWGSTRGPIREAVARARAAGQSVSALHLRYIMPFQPGIQEILDGFGHVFVVEMNDQDQYGRGQLGARLRSAFCHPDICGITKTDGLSFKVREILQQMDAKLALNGKEQR